MSGPVDGVRGGEYSVAADDIRAIAIGNASEGRNIGGGGDSHPVGTIGREVDPASVPWSDEARRSPAYSIRGVRGDPAEISGKPIAAIGGMEEGSVADGDEFALAISHAIKVGRGVGRIADGPIIERTGLQQWSNGGKPKCNKN